MHYHKVNTNLTVKALPASPPAGWHYKVPICWSEPTRIFGKPSQIFKLSPKPGKSQRIPRIQNHLFVSKLFQTFTSLLLMLLGMSDCLKITRRYIEMLQTNHDRNTICSSISTQPFTISWKGFLEAILQCHSAAPWKYHRKLLFVCLFYHYFRVCRVEEGNI